MIGDNLMRGVTLPMMDGWADQPAKNAKIVDTDRAIDEVEEIKEQ